MTRESLPPGVREVLAGVADTVGDGGDARIDGLLEQLVRICSPDVLCELRR
ncbi:hypothetical protein OG539_00930 [Actinacidiphila glaucinigra]|uniref:hypothetical protein n=1 Tax=Actinacidiphila glaucinigra TaxID=235986 RepID=UPI002DD9859E|nr:hypothetical protein [Actinacidiphila glaucinigra]WSD64988.1 hypothetical protein OIE69_42020 [Actinacidiphila glaucinigra]